MAFELGSNPLMAIAVELYQSQQAIIAKAFAYSGDQGYLTPQNLAQFAEILAQPSGQKAAFFGQLG